MLTAGPVPVSPSPALQDPYNDLDDGHPRMRRNTLILLIKSLCHSLLQMESWDQWLNSCWKCLTLWKESKIVCRGPLIHFLFQHQAHHQMA
jgi:hypothetical protein